MKKVKFANKRIKFLSFLPLFSLLFYPFLSEGAPGVPPQNNHFFAMNNSTCGIIQILVQSNSGRTNIQLPPKQEFGPIPGTVISSSISYVPSCFVKATCSYSGQTLSCANNINSPN